MTPKDIRNAIARQCGIDPATVGPIGDFADRIIADDQQGEPTSFSAWLEANQDSIEMPLDRMEATAQWFDERDRDLEHESRVDYDSEHNPTYEE